MTAELDVYWSSVEFHFAANPDHENTHKGGFVYCFVRAFDARTAIQKIEEAMEEIELDGITQNLMILKVDFIQVYDEDTDWETKEQNEIIDEIVHLAKNSHEVIFDVFHLYEEE